MKRRILLILMLLVFLVCPVMASLRQHQVTIVDEFGDPVTNIDIIEILDVNTSTTATIYTNRAGDVNMMNPITTSTADSTFVQSLGLVTWFQAAPTYKITVTESGISQSLTIDNQNEGDTRFPFYANYIGTAASLTVGDDNLLNIGTSADFLHDWDVGNTRYVIYPASDGGRLDFGKATKHPDIYFHAGAVTTDYIFFDEGSLQMSFVDIDLLIDDEAKLLIGDSGDVTIEYDESNEDLDVLSTSALDEISWGATGDGYDQVWHSTTAGDYMLFDYSADALLLEDLTLALGDGELLLFGDTIGTGTMSLSVATAKLSLLQVVADTGTFDIGASGTDVPTVWHGETAGAEVTLTGDTVLVDGIDMTFQDDDMVIFGDDGDFTIDSGSTTKVLDITPGAATDDYIVNFGLDQSGVDIKAFAATTGEYVHWDASADSLTTVGDLALFTMTGTTVPFRVDATGTVSSGNAIELETTDGKVLINADGGTYGDIELNSADDIILTTAGKLTITNTEAVTVSGDSTVTGTLSVVGAYVNPFEIVAATNEIEITESGTVFILNHGTEFATTLPTVASSAGVTFRFIVGVDPAGTAFTILTDSLEDAIEGSVVVDGANIEADGPDDTITFTASAAVVGDWVELTSDGVLWYLSGQGAAATSIVPTKAD